MSGKKTVWMDVLPQGVYRHAECDAVVFVDTMLTTTTAVTSLATGHRTFLAADGLEASELKRCLPEALLVQEDIAPSPGFLSLGPSELASELDPKAPVVLMSGWTHLLRETAAHASVYVASLRNTLATAEVLTESHTRVALLGAGFGGEQRSEDRITAARLAKCLVERGFEFGDLGTAQEMQSWADADLAVLAWGRSAEYLRRVKRNDDLDFVLRHRDDLRLVGRYEDGELIRMDPWGRRVQAQLPASRAYPRPRVAVAPNPRPMFLAGLPVAAPEAK